MQENKLTEAQSLELITSMINDSRTRLARNSGTPFLIWGYTTMVISILVAVLSLYHWQNSGWGWLWLLIPIVGWIGMQLFNKKDQGAKNYIDRVISIIWIVIGISFLLVMFASLFYYIPILFFIILTAGIGTTMTGYIIRNKATKICGIVSMIASLCFPLSRWLMTRFTESSDNMVIVEILLFAVIFIFMMIIPGHILNHKYNNK